VRLKGPTDVQRQWRLEAAIRMFELRCEWVSTSAMMECELQIDRKQAAVQSLVLTSVVL